MARPYSPPPPPYQSSQQELDRKTAQALKASPSRPNSRPHLYAEQDNSWENYDEAAFEAAHEAAVMSSRGSGSSTSTWSSTHSFRSPSTEKWADPISPSVQPLRLHKPDPSDAKSKERPGWLAEAHVAESSTFQPLLSPSTPYGENGGPQPETPERPLVMITYHSNGSAPPSPLSPSPPLIVRSPCPSRPPSRLILPLSPSPQPDHRVPSHSPQPQPLPRLARQVISSVPTVKTSSQPHMVFDYAVAYAMRDDGVVSPIKSRPNNAAEFYNSAVSPHLPISPSKSTPLLHMPQSQHHSHQSVRGTALPSISPTHSVPSFSPYASRSPSAQLPIPSRSFPHPGNAHARWATSEEQIGRDF